MEKVRVRITYRSECFIEADSLAKAKEIWESTKCVPENTENASFEFIEMVSCEDGDTYEDITDEFESANDEED